MISAKSAGRRSEQRFILVNPFGIGDVLFTTPVIRALRREYPGSFIAYWCNQRVEPLLRGQPGIDRVFSLSRGDLKKIFAASKLKGLKESFGLFRQIKNSKFDVSLDFSLDHRYSLLLKMAGVKRRIGLDYKGRGRFLTEKIPIEGYESRHVVEYYLDLLRFLGLEPKSRELELIVPDEDRKKAGHILSECGRNVVGIAPGAGESWGKDASFKHWPARDFAHLADRLIEELGVSVVLLGDSKERPIADNIVSAMRHKPKDLVGKTSLNEFAGIVQRLALLVTNDGGPLHVGVALKVKTVSIFGPVDENVYGPYPAGSGHIVIKKDLPCRPCYRRFRMPECPRNRECINAVSEEEVFLAARRLLA